MLTRMAFNPPDGYKNAVSFPDEPTSEADARAKLQNIPDQLKDFVNNTLIAGLESTTTGSSGAENIGSAPIENVEGTNVRAQIENLKSQIDDISAGAMSDGSVTENKLADGAATTEKVADGAITKDKLAPRALTWKLHSGNYVGPFGSSMMLLSGLSEYSEIMIQWRNPANDTIVSSAVLPLDEDGEMVPKSYTAYSYMADGKMDRRTVTVTAVQIKYDQSYADSIGQTSLLSHLYIYVR